MSIFKLLFNFLGGGVVNDLADQLRRAHEAKLQASTAEGKLDAAHDMARLENAIRMAEVANADRWSATSIGRYLVVIPFGAYLAAICADSIFGFTWDVLKMPDRDYELLMTLFIAIVIGDVAKTGIRALRR